MRLITGILLLILTACSPLKQQRQELIAQHDWPRYEVKRIKNKVVVVGFSKDQVIAAWGRPNDINTAVSKGYRMEQWVYRNLYGYGAQYVYFRNGRVTSIQSW